jgi:hypothetical protein
VVLAGFVPGYSGGTAPASHRLPYYALLGHPNYALNLYNLFLSVKGKFSLESLATHSRAKGRIDFGFIFFLNSPSEEA